MFAISRKRQVHGTLEGGCADLWVYRFNGEYYGNKKLFRDGIAFFDTPFGVVEFLDEYCRGIKEKRIMVAKAIIEDAQSYCGGGYTKVFNDIESDERVREKIVNNLEPKRYRKKL